MNGPFVVAQAGSNANSGADPVQIIKLTKPQAGHTDIFHASFTGAVKIDFTAIANEKITLFHDSKNQSLHVIFADGSQDIIEPFFDSRGTVLSNLLLEMGPNVTMGGEQFAQQFTITEDQSVLPAAGPGGVAAGADFHDPSVDPLALSNPLDLLPPEELPGLQFVNEEAPTFIAENSLPTVSGHVFGIVEEEQLNREIIEELKLHGINTDAGNGNEDTHDAAGGPGFANGAGNDKDTTNFPPGSLNTTQFFNGTLAGLVVGGDLPITFLTNSAANGTTVHDSNGNDLKSIGETVQYLVIDSTTIEGVTPGSEGVDSRVIFILHVNTDGTFTFELTDQIDHPTHSHDFGGNAPGIFEETLNLDLSSAIFAHDATPDPISFPAHTLEIGVIDDTPIAYDSFPNYPQPYYGGEGEGGSGTYSQALDDENQHHGIQGGPGDDGFGKKLSGVLDFSPGADNYNSVSFGTNLNVVVTDGVHTEPVSQLQAIYVDSNGVGHKEDVSVVWTPDGFGGGTLTGSTTDIAKVFTLNVDKFGDYTLCLNAPLAHTFTADPNQPGTTEFEDNLQIVFTYTVTDGDGDQADAHLPINVDDDVPTLCLDTFQGQGEGAVALDVVHDETPGLQSAHGATDVNGSTAIDFNGSPTTIAALFNGIPNPGDDPDVSGHGAIGYAQGLNGLVNVHAKFGADGAAVNQAEVFSLVLPQGDGEWSGLYTTEGDKVYLYKQTINGHDVIVGRIDADHDLAEDSQPGHFDHFDLHDSDDAAAFAITIDPATGKVYLVQYLSLEHFSSPDALGDISEPVTLASGTLSVSVTVTDGDGDSVTQAADVGPEIKFLDDGPSVTVGVDHHFSVVLDETPGVQFEDDDTTSSTVRHLFDSVSNKGNDPDVSSGDKDHGALGFAISSGPALDVNAIFGADGPKLDNHGHPDGTAFSLALSSEGVYSGIDATDGTHIYLYTEDGIIVGRVGSSEGAAAFAVTIDDNGNVATAEWLSLHHNSADNGDIDETVQLASGTINAVVTITDGDGDTASASADISGKVQFEDDGPSLNASLKHNVHVIEDETPGNDSGTNDVSGSAAFNGGTVTTAFAGVAAPVGDDPDVPPASGPIGYALSNGSIVDITSVNFGADGPAVPHGLGYSLVLNGNNIHSGLTTTDGRDIHLFKEGNLIVGRYEVGGNNIPDGSNDEPAAFAISIDPVTGQIAMVQYVSLNHPDSTNPNDIIDLNDNTLFVQVTATDGDGDHVSDKVDVSGAIEFKDDGPTAPSASVGEFNVTVDETPGVQTAADPNPANDVLSSGLPTAVKNLFDAIGSARGVDGDVTPASLDDGALSFAAGNSSILSLGVLNFGADGPFGGSAATGTGYALKVTNGTFSGVQTTDGHDVFLYQGTGALSGLVLGRIGTEASSTPGQDIANANGKVAFALTVDASGHVYIADYVSLLNPNAGNTPAAYDDQIQLASGTVKAVVTLTDGDGDTVSTSGTDISSHIRFQDDGPSAPTVTLTERSVTVDETPGVQTAADPNPANDVLDSALPTAVKNLFDAIGSARAVDGDVAPGALNDGALSFAASTGSLLTISALNFGADGPFGGSAATGESISLKVTNGTYSGVQTTDGHDVFLYAGTGTLAGLILGRIGIEASATPGLDTQDPNGKVAFALTIDASGKVYIADYASLLNPLAGSDGAAFDDQIHLASGTVQAVVTLTDGDGDSISSSGTDISSQIRFQDDGPAVSATVSELNVTVDETPGVQTAADPNPANDVLSSGLPIAIKNLFDAIGPARGVDGDVTPGALDDGALSFAASTGSLLSIGFVNFGADGPFGGSAATGTTLSLKVTDGTYSGVQTTDGHDVFLYAGTGPLAGLVLGRIGIEASTTPGLDTADPAGKVAFALTIDASGKVYIADYVSLFNPSAGSDPAHYDDQIQLASGTVQAVVTLKDGDGDTVATAHNDISSHIRFQDDGPSVTGVNDGTGPNLVQNGSFETGHANLSGADWDIYSTIPGWTAGADGIPFEVQIGGVGGLAAQDGNALIELDGDTTGNPAHQPPSAPPNPTHTDATIEQAIAGTVAGQDYELTFWYSPRPDASAGDDSGLKVLWNGAVVDEIDSTGLPSGWTQITLHVVGTGPGDTLAFQGTGPENEVGAFIDNVSLNAVTVLDDEDTTLNPAVEIQGGPGDDGHGVVAHGQILFNAGADGLKSVVVSGIDGLNAIWVDNNGIGHPEFITQTWVPDGTGGGTLIGTTTHFLSGNPAFTLVVDNTGHYTFTLDAPLDHPLTDDPATSTVETSFEDNLNLGFGFTITDGDNDYATGTIAINVDDDSPEFFNGGIEDATVAAFNTPVTENLNLHFGADGEHANGNGVADGLKITGWTDLPGVTETLSADGKTLTATVDNTNGPGTADDSVLYILQLNTDGTYTITQQHTPPGSSNLTFTVTGVDGDGDAVSDAFNVTLGIGTPLVQSSTFTGTVEEEELGNTAAAPAFASSFVGNEDTTAALGNDFDTNLNSHITTNVTSNTFIVFGGTGPYTYSFASGVEGTQAQLTDSPNAMTSHGAPVYFHIDSGNPNLLVGYADGVGGTADHYDPGIDRVVFTFQINPSTGQGTFSLYDNIDHHTVAAADNIEGTRSLNLNGIVEATDSSPSPQTLSLNGSIGVIDDIPVTQGDAARVNEGGTGTTNFLITIDTSDSMNDDPGVPGFATRLALEKAALVNLLNSTNVNEVFIVDFNTGAADSGGWLGKAAAIAFINGLTASGITNYDAALTDAETAFTHAHTGADQTLAYFLSDGVPNFPALSVGIDPSEQAIWENFLTSNGVLESFAVGVGNAVTTAALDPIAFPNGDPANPVVLTDQSQLSATLTSVLVGITSGNVLINDHFGADGPLGAGIVSITIDGHVYAYNPSTNAITEDNNPFASGTSTLSVNTLLGGHLDFHFTTGGGSNAGDYSYASPPNVNSDTPESFHYVIADGDGDKVGADLNITVVAVNDPPIANDDHVITNIAGSGAAIAIPDAALILNDTDVDGPNLDIGGVGPAVSGFVVHFAAPTTTFTDNNSDGGSFTYTLEDSGTPNYTDTANVTVDRLQVGNSTLTGTSAGEILLDRAGGDDTLVGNGGSDVLVGGDGNDHFLYNATTDGLDHILDFGNGTDSLDFSRLAFGNGLAVGGANTGALDPSHFVTGATEGAFAGAGPGFFYNTTDHTVYFDLNGNSAGGLVAMAKLENNHALVSGEIHVV